MSRLNILLVENEPLVYRHTERLLQLEGYNVAQLPGNALVDTYEKAIAILSSQPVHLAILDIELNGEKDGLDIGHYIADYLPRIPFLFLSNYSNVENFLQAGKTGATDFLDKLEKPFTDNQLKRKLLLLKPKMEAVTGPEKEGRVFNVQEFVAGRPGTEQGFYKKIIRWKDIITITSYDPRSTYTQKNNFFFYLNDEKSYRCHEPLKQMDGYLPPFIVRFNEQEMINIHCIDGKGKSDFIYLIKGKKFTINEANRGPALKAIRLFLHPNF